MLQMTIICTVVLQEMTAEDQNAMRSFRRWACKVTAISVTPQQSLEKHSLLSFICVSVASFYGNWRKQFRVWVGAQSNQNESKSLVSNMSMVSIQ